VESDNHGQLKDEMRKQHIAEDLPLVLSCVLDGLLLDLVLLEGGDLVCYQVGEAARKVDDLMRDEEQCQGHQSLVATLKEGLPLGLEV